MTDEVMREFAAWWATQGHPSDTIDDHLAAIAFAAGWWAAVRTNLENARRG